jgi:ATP-dependent Clp protease ATP-binding subunit ClpB
VDKQVALVAKRLEARRIRLRLEPAARDYLAEVGYDPTYGARPLKRAIQRELETALAKRIIAGEIRDDVEVVVDVTGEGAQRRLTFNAVPLAAAA